MFWRAADREHAGVPRRQADSLHHDPLKFFDRAAKGGAYRQLPAARRRTGKYR